MKRRVPKNNIDSKVSDIREKRTGQNVAPSHIEGKEAAPRATPDFFAPRREREPGPPPQTGRRWVVVSVVSGVLLLGLGALGIWYGTETRRFREVENLLAEGSASGFLELGDIGGKWRLLPLMVRHGSVVSKSVGELSGSLSRISAEGGRLFEEFPDVFFNAEPHVLADRMRGVARDLGVARGAAL